VKLENLELKRQLLDARADLIETRGCLERANARVEEATGRAERAEARAESESSQSEAVELVSSSRDKTTSIVVAESEEIDSMSETQTSVKSLGISDLLDSLKPSPKSSKANVSTPSLFQVTKLVSSSTPSRSPTPARKPAVTFVEPAPAERSSSEPKAPPPKKKMSKMDKKISKLEKKKMRLSMKLENAYGEFGFDSRQVKKLNGQIKQTQTQVAKMKMKRLTAKVVTIARFSR